MEVYFQSIDRDDGKQITDAHLNRGVRDSCHVVTIPDKPRNTCEIKHHPQRQANSQANPTVYGILCFGDGQASSFALICA
jgi:hypothetical protein